MYPGSEGDLAEFKEALKRLKAYSFRVVTLGAMRKGKSSIINALIGQDVVSVGVVPCTAGKGK